MTLCRYFLQGNCRFGDRCRFEHTDPYESNAYDNSSEYDYSYQNRGRQQPAYQQPNYNQGHGRQYNDRYAQNNYSSQRNYRDDRHGSNESFNDTAEPDYYANKYNKNKLSWMSEDYKKQLDQNTSRSDNRFANTSTPKSKTSFSFKDTDVQHSRRERPNDLRMNEKNIIDAEIIKEDALMLELGNQWPFTCYCPTPGKSAFPGFVDLSPEELRLEAYNAKENNSYNSYVESVEKAMLEIKMKREQLKEPSVQLMSIIEKIRRGEDFSHETVDGVVSSLSNFNQTSLESMVAEEFPTPQSNPASSFSFKTPSTTFFGSQANPASSFSFKTTLETDTVVKSSASSFSFKLPAESASKSGEQEADTDIYTPMDKISQQDKEQFSAPTFTLGKIPTVPPPQEMCF